MCTVIYIYLASICLLNKISFRSSCVMYMCERWISKKYLNSVFIQMNMSYIY